MNTPHRLLSGTPVKILLAGAALACLVLTSLYSYLLFHSLVEMFSIVVACGIFVIAWHTRRNLDNGYFLVIGIAFLFVGFTDLLHTLAYKNMGVFRDNSANLPTQLWIAARYLQGAAFLIAPLFVTRKARPGPTVAAFSAATAFLLAAIFAWRIFPDCFVEGAGLTPFKKGSEYAVVLALAGSLFLMRHHRDAFDRGVLRWLGAAIAILIFSELAFTLYTDVFGISITVGHLLKAAGFFLIYKALIETGLVRPYDILFRDLKLSEERYRRLCDELRESEERFRVALMNSPVIVFNQDLALRYTWMFNPMPETCCADAMGKTDGELFKAEEAAVLTGVKRAVLASGLGDRREVQLTLKGKKRILELTIEPLRDAAGTMTGITGAMVDVTEEMEMEAELAKVRKLEAIGILAGGLAHDFNNLLAVILGNISFVKMHVEPEEKLHGILEEGEKACLRASDLTARLITFSEGGAPIRKISDVSKLVRDAALFALNGTNLRCECRIPADLRPVMVDERQIRQVICNLLDNARQAMAEGGVVGIRAENVEEGAKENPTLTGGAYVKISVEDRGAGIPAEHLGKIFDPYFTTTELGPEKGKGLGLAICHSIVRKHEGAISVASAVGSGSTFSIYLPAARACP